ncbi:MAG: WD40/YVTN/BNR-like repeat-containing protein, partial [Longimicrobiales bacterium]
MSLDKPGRSRGGPPASGGEQEEGAPEAEDSWRWNWNTPMVLSPHDPTVLYAAGNRVLKYTDRGEEYEVISPDLTYADSAKIAVSTTTTGGITPDVTGAETFATIVTLAESPLQQGFLFAGTDDGRSWISRNDGGDWEELTGRFPGVPEGTWVRRIEPSSHDVNTFFVAFDGHRTNDFTPYVYMTQDGGRSFRSIAGDLPTGKPDFVHVIRQDLRNPDLLFVGTDVGVYVSLDRGGHWQKFMEGLPTVPVHDLKIHPRDRELIAATHGRSIWIADIAPLQELTAQVVAADIHLFEPRPGLQFGSPPVGGESTGHQFFEAESPSYGAEIAYWIGPEAEIPTPPRPVAAPGERPGRPTGAPPGARPGRGGPQPQVEIEIRDAQGELWHTGTAPGTPGLHRYHWDFRGVTPPPPPKTEEQIQDSIRAVARLQERVDSLVAEASDRAELERMREMLLSGNRQAMMGMFRGAGGGAAPGRDPGAFVERPGESWATGGRGGGGFTPEMRVLFRAARDITGGGGFGGGGRGGEGAAPFAEEGQYTVTLKAGDQSFRQTMTVIRGVDAGEGGGFFQNLW